MRTWVWLVKTDKGDFFITVTGRWSQVEAARMLRLVFDLLKLGIIGMIPRKRAIGPDNMMGTIIEQVEAEGQPAFNFLAGERIWQVCGRGAEYQAQKILLEKSF